MASQSSRLSEMTKQLANGLEMKILKFKRRTDQVKSLSSLTILVLNHRYIYYTYKGLEMDHAS